MCQNQKNPFLLPLNMLRYLVIISFCLFITMATALNHDSLYDVWNDKTVSDTIRLKAIQKLSWNGYLFSQPDSAFYFAGLQYEFAKSIGNKKWMASGLNTQGASFAIRSNYKQAMIYYNKSLKLKKEIGDKKGIAGSYNNIGLIYKNQGDYNKALTSLKEGIKVREEIGDKKGMANTYHNIGLIYQLWGNYIEALKYYNKSFEILKETGDKKGMAASYNNFGMIYKAQKKEMLAFEYYSKSLRIKKEIDDRIGIADSYGNIGLLYYQQGDYEQALEYHTKSLKIYKAMGAKREIASSYHNIGMVFQIRKNFEHALSYYEKSLKIKEEIKDRSGMAGSYDNMGFIAFEQKNFTTALEFGKKSLAIAQELGLLYHSKVASSLLYQVFQKTKRPAKALEMYKLSIQMGDSLKSIENTEASIKLEYQHAYEKEQALAEAKQHEQITLSAEREKRQQFIAYSIGGGLVMVLAFAFFILNRLQVTRRQKNVIEQQKDLVEEQKKDITDSIYYGENIQKALLPSAQELSLIPDGFVLFLPKDIVSGDFYWMQHHNNKVYLAACDCTGHGVPGAFMSMIGSSLLDEAVVEKGITQPNEIFYEVRKGFINALKQTGQTQKDGMDAVLIAWDKKSNLQVAAAYSPVIIIRKGAIQELKPDRQPVGFHTGEQKPFTHHEIKLEKGDTVYLFSDGYPDQFGGPKQKKYMMKNFKKLLLSIQDKTMNEQKTILETTMAEWKGDTEQVDDILVMGVRF